MDSDERVQAAVGLRKPDRVPVAPDMDVYIAPFSGITQRELLFDFTKAESALETCWSELRWDAHHQFLGGCGRFIKLGLPVDFRLPGVDGHGEDELMQAVEKPLAGPEVYEEISERGYLPVHARQVRAVNPELRRPTLTPGFAVGFARYAVRLRRHNKGWERRGLPCLGGSMPNVTAFDILSGVRSVEEFSKDLFREPELVLRALSVVNRFTTGQMVRTSKLFGSRYCFIGSARPSASFISPRLFERFALPFLVDSIAAVVGAGLVPFLHFDSDWTPMLRYFRELPRARCILNIDESTDISTAKEILWDHMCIMGNVSAALLKLGDPGEVESHCERLIREIGAGGGFILSSSCSVPPDARPENVRAMVDSVWRCRP